MGLALRETSKFLLVLGPAKIHVTRVHLAAPGRIKQFNRLLFPQDDTKSRNVVL